MIPIGLTLLLARIRFLRPCFARRSKAISRHEIYVFARFISLPREEAEMRTAERKALRDLDPAAVAEAMAPAREAGRALGRAHRGAA